MNFLRAVDFSSQFNKIHSDYLGNVDRKTVLYVVSGSLIGLGAIYLGKIWHAYGYFKKNGIPTPEYRFLYGNLDLILKNNYSEQLREWTNRFGKVYGYYDGHTPILVTTDLEIINEVFVKKYFTNFSARKMPPVQSSDTSPQLNLVLSTKNRWKRMRNIINPTFSPSKLKELVPLLKVCSDRLIVVIEQNLDKEINITEYSGRMTMDAVFNCAFGIDADIQNHSDNIFLVKTRELLRSISSLNPLLYFLILFKELKPIALPIVSFFTTVSSFLGLNVGFPFFWLIQRTDDILKERLEKNIYRRDYIQILMDSQAEEIDVSKDELQDINKIGKKLTLDEVKINMLQFLVAGYETTALTITHSLFVLATKQDELAKLQDEIDSNLNIDDNLDYDHVHSLPYLDLFVKEVLRMYPVGNNVINRRCIEPTEIKGIKIPKGLIVAVDVLSMHFDQEYWGSIDVNEFAPSRFEDPNINKQAYMPFGIGPRTCVGMRFALLEIKLTLVKILQRYSIVPSGNTPKKIEFRESVAIRSPIAPIHVMFKRRSY